MCKALSLSVFYSVRNLEDITFQIEWTAYGPVAEISASVQSPRFLCSQPNLKLWT